MAQSLADGGVLIADSGGGRILRLNSDGEIVWQVSSLAEGPLAYPRFATLDPSGFLWIADTDNNRVVRASRDGTVIVAIGPELDLGLNITLKGALSQLRVPKWISFSGQSVFVTDYYNSRVCEFAEKERQ
jgi:hypothetical protein